MAESFRERFAAAIRDARRAKKLTQIELASAVEIDQSALSRIESAEQGVLVELAKELMAKLDIDPGEIFGTRGKECKAPIRH